MFLLQWLSVSLYTNKDGVEGASLYTDQAGAQGIDASEVIQDCGITQAGPSISAGIS